MKNWKKAIAVCASAAALVSMAACGSSNAGSKSDDGGKKTIGFVAVGPEGGFGERDTAQLHAAGFTALQLGPRILRTETAGLAMLAMLQALHGDA